MSPTDGYFINYNMPRRVMVTDPSLQPSGTAESKAQEARQEVNSNSNSIREDQSEPLSNPCQPPEVASWLSHQQYAPLPMPTVSSPHSSPSDFSAPLPQSSRYIASPCPSANPRQHSYTETTPLMAARPPPPAYYPPTPNPYLAMNQRATEAIRPAFGQSYNTFLDREGPISLQNDPASMGGHQDEEQQISPRWKRGKTRHCCSWKRIKNIIVILFFLDLAVALIISCVKLGKSVSLSL